MTRHEFDATDPRILNVLQRDSSLSQRELAEKVGMLQNACWRRLQTIHSSGVIRSYSALIDRATVDLGVIAFTMIRTKHHTKDWMAKFSAHIRKLPEVIDFSASRGIATTWSRWPCRT